MRNKQLVRAITKLYPAMDMAYVKAIYDDVSELDDWDYSDIKIAKMRIFGE